MTTDRFVTTIELPWVPATLSGHNNGGWRSKAKPVKLHREWAFMATKAADIRLSFDGDIPIYIHFYPPDDRGDRVNFPNRMKPYFDGIAEAMGVNDKRFLPSYQFHAPVKGGKILVRL